MKTFGELSREEQIALFTAWLDGGEIEYTRNNSDWWSASNPIWNAGRAYRVKETLPSINWDHVGKEFNYLAGDQDGNYWLYGCEPYIPPGSVCWSTRKTEDTSAALWVSNDWGALFASFKPGNCDWQDTLIERPGILKVYNNTVMERGEGLKINACSLTGKGDE